MAAGWSRWRALVSTARPEKLTFDASARAIPAALKLAFPLDAIATPSTIGSSMRSVRGRSRSPAFGRQVGRARV